MSLQKDLMWRKNEHMDQISSTDILAVISTENINSERDIRELMLDDENTTIQELVKEQDLVEQYENKFLRTKKKVNEYLNPKGHGQGDVASIRSSPEKRTSCRLPKIALKVHDGTSLEWLGWWSQFEAIHENPSLSEVDKFHYLIQSMKVGTRAERLVKSYPLTEVNYPKVIDALRDRFGDKTRLAPIHRVSIPRLELCAAVLLTRLVIHEVSVLKLDIKEIVCWADATINLN
ncbi:hypothetical protein LAZ67_2006806 [Cordylochernes scorpioides]|uniref:Uncharacterized protein n=1 Tax=Cordylochernes scorpioides TaxID=51811 RepID=A0ABY6K8W7_9ARAC|nr:hypothetical protein LAZ67_2006806 [Cordylochernes scorpioides]